MSEPDKPKSSISLHFEQNKKLVDMFTGAGLGDETSLVITGKITRIDEYGVSLDLTQLGKTEKPEDDDSIGEDSLEDSPISAVINVT